MKFRGKLITAEDELHIREHQESIRRIVYNLSSQDPKEATIIKEIIERANALGFRLDDLLKLNRKTEEITTSG